MADPHASGPPTRGRMSERPPRPGRRGQHRAAVRPFSSHHRQPTGLGGDLPTSHWRKTSYESRGTGPARCVPAPRDHRGSRRHLFVGRRGRSRGVPQFRRCREDSTGSGRGSSRDPQNLDAGLGSLHGSDQLCAACGALRSARRCSISTASASCPRSAPSRATKRGGQADPLVPDSGAHENARDKRALPMHRCRRMPADTAPVRALDSGEAISRLGWP